MNNQDLQQTIDFWTDWLYGNSSANIGLFMLHGGRSLDACKELMNTRAQPEPMALTVEQLRDMEDIPIWVTPKEDESMWCVWDGSRAEIPGCDHWWWDLEDYGKAWIAFTVKPEDGGKDGC